MDDTVDRITLATRTVALVILFNKPFYPLYVWYFVGTGVATSCLTLLSIPLFAGVVFASYRSPALARLMLPLVGTVDTIGETFVFGQASGCELFLAACAMLAALSFYRDEWIRKALVTGAIFAGFALFHGRYGTPFYSWTDDELAILRNINIFAVASLLVFLPLRFPSALREFSAPQATPEVRLPPVRARSS